MREFKVYALLAVTILCLTAPSLWLELCRHSWQSRTYSETDHFLRVGFKTSEKICWEREGKEFWSDGLLYDVRAIQKTSDSVVVVCLPDAHETSLFRLFSMSDSKDK